MASKSAKSVKAPATKKPGAVELLGTFAGGKDSATSNPIIAGERVFWGWTRGLLGLDAKGKELFRHDFETYANRYTDQPRLLHVDGRLIFRTATGVHGAQCLRIVEESGKVLTEADIPRIEHVGVAGGRLFVFTRHFPRPEDVKAAKDRLQELGPEGALQCYRDLLRFMTPTYEKLTHFPNGDALVFDLASGKHVGTVRFGSQAEARKAAFVVGEHVVMSPVDELWDLEVYEDSNTTRVHRLDGTLVWKKPVRLLGASQAGVLVRNGGALEWLKLGDGASVWQAKALTDELDIREVDRFKVADPVVVEVNLQVMRGLDLGTGRELWRQSIGGQAQSFTIEDGIIWADNAKGRPAAYSLATGEPLGEAKRKLYLHVAGNRRRCATPVRDGTGFSLDVYTCELG